VLKYLLTLTRGRHTWYLAGELWERGGEISTDSYGKGNVVLRITWRHIFYLFDTVILP